MPGPTTSAEKPPIPGCQLILIAPAISTSMRRYGKFGWTGGDMLEVRLGWSRAPQTQPQSLRSSQASNSNVYLH